MLDSMLESRTLAQTRSRWAFPLSVATHVMAIGALVAASLLITVSLKEPAPSIIFAGLAPTPLPRPLALPPARQALHDQQDAERTGQKEEELVQPDEPPDQPLFIEDSGTEDSGSDAGVPGGAPDGDPHGILHGDPLGFPSGVSDARGGIWPSTRQGPLVVTPEMTPPVLKHRLEPEYPEAARVARLPGRVILQAVISPTGQVEDVTVLRSSNRLFDEAAIEAVRQWEYEPARQGGRPVAVYFTIDVVFTLH